MTQKWLGNVSTYSRFLLIVRTKSSKIAFVKMKNCFVRPSVRVFEVTTNGKLRCDLPVASFCSFFRQKYHCVRKIMHLPIHDRSDNVTWSANWGRNMALKASTAPTLMPPNPPITVAAKIWNWQWLLMLVIGNRCKLLLLALSWSKQRRLKGLGVAKRNFGNTRSSKLATLITRKMCVILTLVLNF